MLKQMFKSVGRKNHQRITEALFLPKLHTHKKKKKKGKKEEKKTQKSTLQIPSQSTETGKENMKPVGDRLEEEGNRLTM